jgi:hypothetical protein
MRRVAAAVLTLICVGVSPSGAAPPAKAKAIATVRAVLKANAPACGYRIGRLTAVSARSGWRVTALTTGRTAGTSRWAIAAGKASPLNALARRIRAGCPVAAPPPPPPPPPPAPPLGGPGAPAAYVFGPEVSALDRARLQRGLDVAARYFRSVLGRELPSFTVWAHNDLEGIVRSYAENAPAPADYARQLWTGGQVGHGRKGKLFFGPNYFGGGRPDLGVAFFGALQIAGHEAAHLFQYDLINGDEKLGAPSLDQVPVAGPWWLEEGMPTYLSDLAVVREGLVPLRDLQAQWRRSARLTGATLADLSARRAEQRWGTDARHAATLATEVALRDRDPRAVLDYYAAIGNGTPWPDAFAAAFGRAHEAVAAEYEAAKASP